MSAAPIVIRVRTLRRAVLRWYRAHARDLPWRRSPSAYGVLVSEVMLQQTQVDRVVPKYSAFLERFPSLKALARARLADVLCLWSGLGYNRRAKRLWECARAIVASHAGRVPADPALLRALPGLGRYSAGAVASFAFGVRTPVVDVNVRRVLSRALLGCDDAGEARVWRLAADVLPRRDAGAWSQALMDIGAHFCRRTPKCDACPARRACVFAGRGASRRRPVGDTTTVEPDGANARREEFVGSRRYYRGRAVRALVGAPHLSLLALGEQVKAGFATTDLPWLRDLLAELEREGLVTVDARRDRAALP